MNDNIRWLDGKSAEGKFILELNYTNGGTGYLKNESEERINHYYEIMADSPEIAGLTIYRPDGSIVVQKVCFGALLNLHKRTA